MKCPHCGHDNPAGQKFCGNCGKPLTSSVSPLPRGEGLGVRAGERKLVTVLFADVVGSTAMAEQIDPEEVTEIMNGAFAFLNAAVSRYGGTVARLMGDAILAFFGAPATHEDDAERAVRAGLDMQTSAREYARTIKQKHGLDFQVRVGINTGLAVLDLVGDQIKTEYTAMGDATNVAARMQSAATPGTVLIGADTYRLVKAVFDFKPRGAIEIKGKSAPVEVYEVLAVKETPGKARGLEGLASPLVGREAEFDLLRAKVEAVRAGQGAFVAAIGEAGLGKSRLIAEARKSSNLQPPISNLQPLGGASQSEISNPQWLEARSVSYGQSISYYPWRQIIRQSIGAHEGETPAEVRRKLNFTCDCCTLPGGDRPFLEALLAVASDESLKTVQGYEGEALRQRMTEATRGYVCGIAQETPTVLVFDDVHWADSASLDLLLSLGDVVERYPLLILCLLRPDRDAPSWPFVERVRGKLPAHYFEIALEPLSDEQARELLGNLLYIEDLPESVRGLILSKSEGNPFFVEEVIRSLIDSGHIVREKSHWRATREIVGVAIPNTLAGVLSARIDRLPDDTKRVGQMASVIGRTFAQRVLKIICDTAPAEERVADPDRHLQALTRAELVRERAREPELEYTFKHALTQEAAYNSLLIKRRKEFHRRVGATLEGLHAARLDEFAPTLAHHFWSGDDWARAADYSLAAGAAATKVYALREAMGHYDRALQAWDKIPDAPRARVHDAILGWVEAAFKFKPYAEQLERLARAERIAREANDKPRLARALYWTGQVHIASGYAARSLPALAECFALADELGDERLAIIPTYFTGFGMMEADPRGAIALFDRAIELAHQYGDRDMEAEALGTKGVAHARLGEFEQARAAIQQALELAQGPVSPTTASDVDLFAAWSYLDMGDVQRGLEYGQSGVNKAMAADNMDCVCYGYACLGFGNLQAQKLPEAVKAFEESIKRTRYSGAAHIENLSAAGLAIAEYYAGRAGAIEDLEKVIADAQTIGNLLGAAIASQALGDIHIRLGELDRAEAHLHSAADYYRRTDMRLYYARALRSLAQLYEGQGRSAEAEAARSGSEALMKEPG